MKKYFIRLLMLVMILCFPYCVFANEFYDGIDFLSGVETADINSAEFTSMEEGSSVLFYSDESDIGISQDKAEEISSEEFLLTGQWSGNRDWKWPVPGSNKLSSCYLDGRGHYALDIMAPNGSEIYASYPGTVLRTSTTCSHNYGKNSSCGCGGGLGNYVYILHNYNGISFVSRYGHMSKINVTEGSTVSKDSLIGLVGSTGYSTGFHLDFRIYQGNTATSSTSTCVDPFKDQFLEMPAGLNASGATTQCCYTYVDEVKQIYSGDISVSGHNVPPNLNAGQTFSIYGTISSNSNLTSVTVGVYDANGNSSTTKTVNPNSKSYNIHDVDKYIYFNALPTGSYIYKVTATNASGTHTLINSAFSVAGTASSLPHGSVDEIRGGEGYVHVKGWVIDDDAPTQSLEVHVYIGGPAGTGASGYVITANTLRTDIGNSYPSAGNYHGFDSNIPLEVTGNQAVYIYAINVGAGTSNPVIGCKEVTISPAPLKKYTVSYNGNGGSGIPGNQEKTQGNALTLATTVPTKNFTLTYNGNGGSVSNSKKVINCSFSHWNTEIGGNGVDYSPGGIYNADADVTLYAQWKRAAVGSLSNPLNRNGFEFVGWYTQASGGTKVTLLTEITKDMTVYAHWNKITAPLEVNFKTSNGTEAYSGSNVTLTAQASGGTGGYTYKFLVCDAAGNWYKIRDYATGNTAVWTTGAVGKKTLYVDVKDSNGNYKRQALSFEVKNKPLAVTMQTSPSGKAVSGSKVVLSARASGGSSGYTYKFLVCDAVGNWYKLRDYSKESSFTWYPDKLGKKTLYVDVKDSSGNYKRQSCSYEITAKPLTASLTASPSGSAQTGSKVTLSAGASGGSGSYTYKFLVCDAAGNWYKLRDFDKSSSMVWTTGSAGKKTLYVDVKDSSGQVVRKALSYTVNEVLKPLTVQSFLCLDGEKIAANKNVTLKASASGGSGTYQYQFRVYNMQTDSWFIIRDYAAANTVTWNTGAAGEKLLFVTVRDSKGTSVQKGINVSVSGELTITDFTSSKGNWLIQGTTSVLTAKTSGGLGVCQYKFLICDENGNWYKIQDFGSKNTCNWYAGKTGIKTLYVDAKDQTGKVVRRELKVIVTEAQTMAAAFEEADDAGAAEIFGDAVSEELEDAELMDVSEIPEIDLEETQGQLLAEMAPSIEETAGLDSFSDGTAAEEPVFSDGE